MAGDLIGRYQLEELVSRGGMGEVWRARDVMLDRPVAVKLLYEDNLETADQERFLREGRAAARLVHPNVVATHDVGHWQGRPYLVMEFLDGPSVAATVRERGCLPVQEIRQVGAQAAAALACAHSAGVVHRDVKPANLVWTSDGTLKLVDFGLAWLLNETAEAKRLTPAGTAMGTTSYLPPETAKGQVAGTSSDLYALGCVLYELACGRPPFEGAMPDVILAHLNQRPTPPSELRTDLPADLEALILDLLIKDPAQRPSNAEDVRRRLLGLPGTAPAPVASAGRAPARSRRALLSAAGLAGAAMVAGGIKWALSSTEPDLTGESTQSPPTTRSVVPDEALRSPRPHQPTPKQQGQPDSDDPPAEIPPPVNAAHDPQKDKAKDNRAKSPAKKTAKNAPNGKGRKK